MYFFRFDNPEGLPIVIRDIGERELFCVPAKVWDEMGEEILAAFLKDSGVLGDGAQAYIGDSFVGTTEY